MKEVALILLTAGVGCVASGISWLVVRVLDATQKNTLAIVMLTVKLEDLVEKIAIVPKLERDVNVLHSKLRNDATKKASD